MKTEIIFEKADKLGAERTRIIVSVNFIAKDKDGATGSQLFKEEAVMPHPKGDDYKKEEERLIKEMEEKINRDMETLVEKGAIVMRIGKMGNAIFPFVEWELSDDPKYILK